MAKSGWTLALMRHAKSDWANEGLSDHDRPLNARGRRDSPEMAKWLAKHDAVPQVILASTAKRVEDTVQRMVKFWKIEPLILRVSSLYLASPLTILEHIRCEAIDADGKRPSKLLVLGHNPGMEQLVSSLAGINVSMPTASVALFECDAIHAEDAEVPNVMRLIAIGRPKEMS